MNARKKNNNVSLPQTRVKKGQRPIWPEKLGGYLIDVSKYLLTGVLISSLIRDFEESRGLLYWLGGVAAVVTLIGGLILVNNFTKRDK